MSESQIKLIKNELKEYNRKIRELRNLRDTKASFDDIRSITIRRTKIEQWVDEPFFADTIKGLFVKVGNKSGKKFLLAEVKDVLMNVNN